MHKQQTCEFWTQSKFPENNRCNNTLVAQVVCFLVPLIRDHSRDLYSVFKFWENASFSKTTWLVREPFLPMLYILTTALLCSLPRIFYANNYFLLITNSVHTSTFKHLASHETKLCIYKYFNSRLRAKKKKTADTNTTKLWSGFILNSMKACSWHPWATSLVHLCYYCTIWYQSITYTLEGDVFLNRISAWRHSSRQKVYKNKGQSWSMWHGHVWPTAYKLDL